MNTIFSSFVYLFQQLILNIKLNIYDMKKKYIFLLGLMFIMADVSAQRTVTVEEQNQSVADQSHRVLKRKVAIGRFSNETMYGKGIFYDKANDPMGKQALDILSTKLAASGKFLLLERSDMDKLIEESKKEGATYQNVGADYLILGSITQFGRKDNGNVKLFSTTKTQTVEATVSIRLVDVSSGLIIYSAEASGNAEQKNKTTMGIGGRADFDETLSDKAISAAISQLVENIINKCTDNPWRSYFLSYDNDAILVSGGKSQGIEVGNTFAVKLKGKKVKNPQTGLTIELPRKKIGEVKVQSTGGDTPETEYSTVTYQGDSIDTTNLTNYYIEEEQK